MGGAVPYGLLRARGRDAAALRAHFFAKGFMYDRFRRREPLSDVKIVVEPGEFIDSIAQRFKKVVQGSEILTDARRHQYFVPKSERRRAKSIRARKRRDP
jgi:ribosomal protein S21